MEFFYLIFAFHYCTGFVIERRNGPDICDALTCSIMKPICSSWLEGRSIDCYSCGDIIKGHFSGRCIPHFIKNNVELFGLPPLLTLEFDIDNKKWNNYTSFKKDSRGRIILNPRGRSGKAYLLVTSRVIVALKFAGVDRTFPVTTTTSSSAAKSSTNIPTTTHPPTTTARSTSQSTRAPATTAIIPTFQTTPPSTSIITQSPSSRTKSTSAWTPPFTFHTTIKPIITSSCFPTTASTVNHTQSSTTRSWKNATMMPTPPSGDKTPLIIGVVFGSLILLTFLTVLCCLLFKKLNIARYILPELVPDDAISMSTINTLPDEDTSV